MTESTEGHIYMNMIPDRLQKRNDVEDTYADLHT